MAVIMGGLLGGSPTYSYGTMDPTGEVLSDSELEARVRAFIDTNYTVKAAAGYTAKEIKDRIVERYMTYHKEGYYTGSEIGPLQIRNIVNLIAPHGSVTERKGESPVDKAAKNPGGKTKVDSQGLTAEQLMKLAQMMVGEAGNAYDKYIELQMLKAKGQDIQVPNTIIVQNPTLPVKQDYTWVWVAGALALGGVILVAAMSGKRRSRVSYYAPALPAPSSPAALPAPVIDVKALPAPA